MDRGELQGMILASRADVGAAVTIGTDLTGYVLWFPCSDNLVKEGLGLIKWKSWEESSQPRASRVSDT